MLGVVNEVPVETEAPPVAPVYHMAVPDAQVALSVTVPVPQIEAGVVVGAVVLALIVAVTGVLPDSQFASDLQLT